jgi:hypothetical protein
VLNPTPIIPGPTTQGPSIETRIDPPKVDPGSPTGIQSRIDSSEAPLVRPDPVYPRTAQTRGIEGWVEIDEVGSAQFSASSRSLRSTATSADAASACR